MSAAWVLVLMAIGWAWGAGAYAAVLRGRGYPIGDRTVFGAWLLGSAVSLGALAFLTLR